MSAYVVSEYHINALVTYAAFARIGYYWQGKRREVQGDQRRVASVLHAENVRSVNARYSIADPAHGHEYRIELANLSDIGAIKACHGLAYQSCETDDWEETEAAAILRAIEASAVRKLPGYDEAAWELRGQPSRPVVRRIA